MASKRTTPNEAWKAVMSANLDVPMTLTDDDGNPYEWTVPGGAISMVAWRTFKALDEAGFDIVKREAS